MEESESALEHVERDAREDEAPTRRRFMRLALPGGAAAAVGLATQSRTAIAGHDGTDVFHLQPPGTSVIKTIGPGILVVQHTGRAALTSRNTATFSAVSHGVLGFTDSATAAGVFGEATSARWSSLRRIWAVGIEQHNIREIRSRRRRQRRSTPNRHGGRSNLDRRGRWRRRRPRDIV